MNTKSMPLYVLLIIVSIALSPCRSISPEIAIANKVKASLVNVSTSQVTHMMKKHLQQMQLYSKTNGWAHPRLKSISKYLLPRKLDGSDLTRLVDRIVKNIKKNKYLQNFLAQADHLDFPDLASKVSLEGPRVFPDVAAYAMVLNRLVGAMMKDIQILGVCRDIWKSLYNPGTVFTGLWQLKSFALPAFSVVKTVSIDMATEWLLNTIESGDVDSDGRGISLNLIEAKAKDLYLGNFPNAKVAATLARHTPDGQINNCTGAGPAQISEDGKSVDFHIAFPLQWADLYQTWNMAFVTNVEWWPYFFVKLLIPKVSSYKRKPRRYLNNRLLGLYIHINWWWMGLMFGFKVPKPDMNWINPQLTGTWGKVNFQSAKDYESLLSNC